ncbi:hypothetical protein Vi05172_g2918 [Venturia inaequalis]|nr:hypothetical protein Vi05172_g2918 [Venturia inaequalis]
MSQGAIGVERVYLPGDDGGRGEEVDVITEGEEEVMQKPEIPNPSKPANEQQERPTSPEQAQAPTSKIDAGSENEQQRSPPMNPVETISTMERDTISENEDGSENEGSQCLGSPEQEEAERVYHYDIAESTKENMAMHERTQEWALELVDEMMLAVGKEIQTESAASEKDTEGVGETEDGEEPGVVESQEMDSALDADDDSVESGTRGFESPGVLEMEGQAGLMEDVLHGIAEEFVGSMFEMEADNVSAGGWRPELRPGTPFLIGTLKKGSYSDEDDDDDDEEPEAPIVLDEEATDGDISSQPGLALPVPTSEPSKKVTFGPSTKIYEYHDQFIDVEDQELVSAEIVEARKPKPILKRTATPLITQDTKTTTTTTTTTPPRPSSPNIPDNEIGGLWTHLSPVATLNEAYHELSEFHAPQEMWGDSMDDMLSRPDARAWLNLTSRVVYQRDGFKAITAPNTTSILESIVADAGTLDTVDRVDKSGWSRWSVRSYEVDVVVDEGEKVAKKKNVRQGSGEEQKESEGKSEQGEDSKKGKENKSESSSGLVRLVVNQIISSTRAALLNPIFQLLKRWKMSIINWLIDAYATPSLNIQTASRYVSKQSKRAEFLALEQMPEIHRTRDRAIQRCLKERGPRTSLWSESNFTRLNYWEFEVEELLHCVKYYEVNCEEELWGFLLDLESKEERVEKETDTGTEEEEVRKNLKTEVITETGSLNKVAVKEESAGVAEVMEESEVEEGDDTEEDDGAVSRNYMPQISETPAKAFPPNLSFQEPHTSTWKKRLYKQRMVRNEVTEKWSLQTVVVQEPWDDKLMPCRFCSKRDCNIRNRKEVDKMLHVFEKGVRPLFLNEWTKAEKELEPSKEQKEVEESEEKEIVDGDLGGNI